MIACVAVVGPKNNPLFIQPIEESPTNPLKFDYVIYVCLDAIDGIVQDQLERGKSGQARQASGAPGSGDGSGGADGHYLGLVSVTPDFHVYAHLTANLTKLLVLVTTTAKPPSTHRFHDDMVQLFAQLERAYKHAASNPFHTAGTMIDSPKCTERVLSIVAGSFRGAAAQQAPLETSALR